jgi:hypothetical protein
MKPSEFNSIIQKRGNKTILWGFVILFFITLLIISVLIFVQIDDISLGRLIWKSLF